VGFSTLPEVMTLIFPQQFEPKIFLMNDLGVSLKIGP
jgi:hypothetical protein